VERGEADVDLASFAGRRMLAEDGNASQLSPENMGGSRDDLRFAGRNPDKELASHSGKVSFGFGGDKVSFADLRRKARGEQFHASGISINYNDEDDRRQRQQPQPQTQQQQQQQAPPVASPRAISAASESAPTAGESAV